MYALFVIVGLTFYSKMVLLIIFINVFNCLPLSCLFSLSVLDRQFELELVYSSGLDSSRLHDHYQAIIPNKRWYGRVWSIKDTRNSCSAKPSNHTIKHSSNVIVLSYPSAHLHESDLTFCLRFIHAVSD